MSAGGGPSATSLDGDASGYLHEAWIYSGLEEFLDGSLEFIRDGMEEGEPVLVVVDRAKLDRLRDLLGDDVSAAVEFADMAEVGKNPGCLIALWRAFVARHPGRSTRGIGEPANAWRTPDELVECEVHESLLNVAIDPASPLRLRCPYDRASLPAAVVGKALTTHPVIEETDLGRLESRAALPGYRAPDAAGVFDRDLAPAPPGAAALEFTGDTLAAPRRAAAVAARAAGLPEQRVDDLVVAVNEIATNAVVHGGGAGVLRTWEDAGGVVCEIVDGGRIAEPLVGRLPAPPGSWHGRGLWIANQFCDLVQVRSSASGTRVRLRLRP